MRKLADSIYLENIAEVKTILENEPNLIDEKDEHGVLMALLAAKTGNLELVKYIVEYSRASMNIHDDNNKNMLHYAAMSGSVPTCRYLVERVGMSPLSGDIESVVGHKLSEMYHNPIRTGMYPDPSIVRVEDDYYMVNSSFIFYPCIPVSHSKDLIHWKIIGYAITEPEWAALDDLEGGRGYWAPDISYYKGRFYITATYRLNDTGNVYRKQIVVSSDKPEGPYSKPAIIDEDGIDPSIFNDDDGRRYMLLNRGARIFELNEDATKQISKAELLFYGDNKRAPEGPHLLKKDGYYYLFEAEGGTGPGHRITVSRSRELKGIYEPCPYNPIMRQNNPDEIIQRCGHGKPVQTQNGDWYMVYLCGRKIGDGYSILGRETALDPISWTMDGWPIVNNLKGPSALQVKPDLPEMIWEDESDDDFNNSYLSNEWWFPRVPEMDGIKLKDSYVHIKGSKYDLDTMKAKNILLRRQKHFRFSAVCKLCMPELYPGQNCGMTCYYDENTYIKFGVFATLEETPRLMLNVVEKIGDEVITHDGVCVDNNNKDIYLKIDTNNLRRTFSYSYNDKDYNKVVSLDNVYYLCDEGIRKGKRFTGAMIGMYAYAGDYGSRYTDSEGRHGTDDYYAAFDYFRYKA